MVHKPYDRQFTVPSGSVLKSGGSLDLSKGQIGLFGIEDTTQNGLAAFFSLKGVAKNKKFELRVGRGSEDHSSSGSDKDYSTPSFTLEDVIALNVSAPVRTEPLVDDVVLGYNGIDPATTFDISKGDRIPIFLKLTGASLGLLGYDCGEVVIQEDISVPNCPPVNPNVANCAPCDPCEPISCKQPIMEAIERLRDKELLGMTKLREIIDITPVFGCTPAPAPVLTAYNTFCLEVCDTGDDYALSLVQMQYPGYKVKFESRSGSTTKYNLVAKTGYTPAAYKQSIPSLIKGCENCPTNYTAVEGGLVYALTIEDEGVDMSSVIESLPNAVAGTALKADGQVNGVGFYTVVLTKKLTNAQVLTFGEANPTATVKYVNTVKSICTNSTITSIAWTACGTCNATVVNYTIDLPDNECGENRLEELQAAYSELVISLEGTTGGCQTRYKTSVPTNIVCDECDPIYMDYFTSEAPDSFEGHEWVEVVAAPVTDDCLCGIRFRGKLMVINPGMCDLDAMTYQEDSVKIEVSAGFQDEVVYENFPVFNDPVAVTYIQRWAPRTHVAGNMRIFEKESHTYFTGFPVHQDRMARNFLGEETLLSDGSKQVVDFELIIRPKVYVRRSELVYNTISFHTIVLVGQEKDVEELMNNIASAAGVTPVKALA